MQNETMSDITCRLERTETGATMPEYALMCGLIMVVCVGGVLLFGQAVNLLFLSFPN